jgi:hypothetical protein
VSDDGVVLKSRPDPRRNIRWGGWTRLLAPGFGHCRRCKTSWMFVREHTTRYWFEFDPATGTGQALSVFCLCEKCWAELIPEERLSYYLKSHLTYHHEDPEGEDAWRLIRDAVLAGG